ncbi:helix-turn-helix transcriptional regulator [Streptomyces sp. JV176]|uniref:helix-turn-helix domain-containing protein n=1 Tax=Streptomyces sp. JV176 TaxID=858630 RepID=UPI002E7A3258|nr:helix-turn-helix transcriptional regulator [Streptomyces sp. JV176]MEE1799936.1 helix-turn-helix transcriptional regulator [Streptomyces sp. JV176]
MADHEDTGTGRWAGAGTPPLVALQGEGRQGTVLELHDHPQHLLGWSTTATVSLRTDTRCWLVPPTHALWVPAGTAHSVEVLRAGRVCVVVIGPADCPIAWTEPTGVLVTPLVRELILHLDGHTDPDPVRARAGRLLVDLLEPVPSTTFHVPLPEDPRARLIADALIADPGDPRDLAAWADDTHTSVRTISRLFSQETGLTFAQWRTHARVRAAVSRLARGASVGATARAVGYRKPAAFSAAFRRVTGQHPGVYQQAGQDQGPRTTLVAPDTPVVRLP